MNKIEVTVIPHAELVPFHYTSMASQQILTLVFGKIGTESSAQSQSHNTLLSPLN